jgi:hypothetical protein
LAAVADTAQPARGLRGDERAAVGVSDGLCKRVLR